MSSDDLWREVPAIDERSGRALAAAERWVGGEVHGVAIGRTEEGEACVVVYTTNPRSPQVQALPEECEGLPVRVQTGGAFRAES
jgi:hypothetical protein